jgi:hypothetical protein
VSKEEEEKVPEKVKETGEEADLGKEGGKEEERVLEVIEKGEEKAGVQDQAAEKESDADFSVAKTVVSVDLTTAAESEVKETEEDGGGGTEEGKVLPLLERQGANDSNNNRGLCCSAITSALSGSGVFLRAVQPESISLVKPYPANIVALFVKRIVNQATMGKMIRGVKPLGEDVLGHLGMYDFELDVGKHMNLDYYVNIPDATRELVYFGAARNVCTYPGMVFSVSAVYSLPTGAENSYIPVSGLVYGEQVLLRGCSLSVIFLGAQWEISYGQPRNFIPDKNNIFLLFGNRNRLPDNTPGDAVLFMSTFQSFLDDDMLGISGGYENPFHAFNTKTENACKAQFSVMIENLWHAQDECVGPLPAANSLLVEDLKELAECIQL